MAEEDKGRNSADFGTLLRRYRVAANLSQEALAERARISVNGVGSLERGDRRTPRRETLSLLLGALALNAEQRREFEAAASLSAGRRPQTPESVGRRNSETASLPLALTSFVGRDRELAEIGALVLSHRMVTLTGTGGVGKTQTALRVASLIDESGRGPVRFVDLAPIHGPQQVVAMIASTLNVQEVPHRALLDTLSAYLKERELLLILDNCEHVIADAAIASIALLSACSNVRILATSREPLRAAGEYAYRLPALGFPSLEEAGEIRATEASSYGAVALFTDRAIAVERRFELTDANAAMVAELCRRLDGIPLAIELAAARVNLLTVKQIADRLDVRFRILNSGSRTALPRQQTMRATIDWSYDLLSAPEQRTFERLSVFAGGCGLDAATSVCGDEGGSADSVYDSLSSLIDKSLLVADLEGSEPRYRLLESFREYAHEKLVGRGGLEIAKRRHALAYFELAEHLDRVFYYDQQAFRAPAHQEMDNWRAVLQWALLERGDVVLGQRLISTLRSEWLSFALLEGRRWLVAARDLVDEHTPKSVLAGLDHMEALIASALSQDDVQLACSRSAIACYRVLGDSLGIALARSLEAQVLLNLGRVAEAKSALNEALRLARDVGNRWLVGYVLRLFAYAGTLDGDLDGARDCILEAQQHYEAVGAKADFAWTMEALGGIEFRAGNAELAVRYATEALTIFRTLNRVRGVAWMLHHVIDYLVALGRYGEAERSAREGLDLALKHNLDVVAAYSLQNLGVIAALRPQSEPERALEVYERVARICGFVDARLAAMGSSRRWLDNPEQEPDYHRALVVMRAALGGKKVAKLMAEGAAMTEEQGAQQAALI